MNTYWHRGEIGDILYSLPFIRARGGGKLLINRYSTHGHDQHAALAPLLALQPYITALECVGEAPQVAINQGRVMDLRVIVDCGDNHTAPVIVRPYFDRTGEPWPGYAPWLEVSAGGEFAIYYPNFEYTAINLTHRYRDPKFRWGEVLPAGAMIFVGLHDEFAAFIQHLGITGYGNVQRRITWFRTPDMLETARIIKGATAFFGNASACLALAQGVGQPNIYVEVDGTTRHSCLYGHEHVLNGAAVGQA